MGISNKPESKIHSTERSQILSILPRAPDKYPSWMHELFLRLSVIYEGKWTHSIQDPKMLELKKAEWFETLKEFNRDIVMETAADVKKIPCEFPSLQKFYEIAKSKAKIRKEKEEMEKRTISSKVEQRGNSLVAQRAREEIRRLCRLKGVTRFEHSSGAGK